MGIVRNNGHATSNLSSTVGAHVGNAAPIPISRTSLYETGIIPNLYSIEVWNYTYPIARRPTPKNEVQGKDGMGGPIPHSKLFTERIVLDST